MNKSDAAFVVRRVYELWPKCEWGEQIEEIFGAKIARYDRDPTVKAIEDYRMSKTGPFVDPAALHHHIRERLRTPTDYGYRLPGFWNTIAAKMEIAGQTTEQVIKAYWKSFESVWCKESLWLGVYHDARQWIPADIDNAAWIADQTIGEVDGCFECVKLADADTARMLAKGRKKATEEIVARLTKKDNDTKSAFSEVRAAKQTKETGGEEFDF